MDNHTKITNALSSLLNRTNDDAFVIIEQLPSGKFVQFTGSATDPLYLDLPAQTLSEEEFERATQFFLELGVEVSNHQLLDKPGGEVVAQQTSFNMVIHSVQDAANLVRQIFTVIYEFPVDCRIGLVEN